MWYSLNCWRSACLPGPRSSRGGGPHVDFLRDANGLADAAFCRAVRAYSKVLGRHFAEGLHEWPPSAFKLEDVPPSIPADAPRTSASAAAGVAEPRPGASGSTGVGGVSSSVARPPPGGGAAATEVAAHARLAASAAPGVARRPAGVAWERRERPRYLVDRSARQASARRGEVPVAVAPGSSAPSQPARVPGSQPERPPPHEYVARWRDDML